MRKFLSLFIVLITLAIVIVTHELGHFIACKVVGVGVERFSIGFGPVLVGYKIGLTEFALSALPFGGYVSMDQASLMAQPYHIKMAIVLAGILFNIACAFFLLCLLLYTHPTNGDRGFLRATIKNAAVSLWELVCRTTANIMGIVNKNDRSITTVPLVEMIHSMELHHERWGYYLLTLSGINVQVAIFNLVPLPFFDGQQCVAYTVRALMGNNVSSLSISMISFALILLTLFIGRSFRKINNPTHGE